VSEGLAARLGREMVFTLRRRPGEESARFPRDPLHFFADLYERVEQGHRPVAGDYARFAYPGGFLGHHGLVGVAYVASELLDGADRGEVLPGVDLHGPTLTAIFLHGPEAELAERCGSYRPLTLLGYTNRYYPCPPWSDRDRPCVFTAGDLEQSLLSDFPVLCVRGATVCLEGSGRDPAGPSPVLYGLEQFTPGRSLRLTVARDCLPSLRDFLNRIPEHVPFVVVTDPHPSASARLAWRPGQGRVEAIMPNGSDGSRLTGGFVAFLPSDDLEFGNVHEDGFAVALRAAAWRGLRRALETGRPYALPPPDGWLGFILEWAPAG
jgi:hypothetical protein